MKLLIRIGIGLALLAVLAVGLALIFAGPLCKAAIEGGGTWATGVETRVEDVSAGLISGEFGLEGLSIANPPGFRSEPFLELRLARTAWESRSLLADEIHVKGLAIDGLALRLERGDKGTNYGVILDHIEKRGGKKGQEKPQPAPAEPAGKARTLVVDRIVLRDLSAELTLGGITDKPLRASVPRLEISDFRSDGSTTEIIGQLLSAIVESALSASIEAGHGIFPADLTKDLERRLGDVGELLKGAGDPLKEAGKALDGLLEGLPKGGKKAKKP